MSLTRTPHDNARLHFPPARVAAAVRALDEARRARVRDAAHAVIDCLQDFADRRQVPLAATVVGDHAPCLWQHYTGTNPGTLDDRPHVLHHYYHSHPVSGARDDEHGHYHLFAQLGTGDDNAPQYTHIVAIGVDARGLPLRLFTTNRWVTGERWLPADTVMAHAERIVAEGPSGNDPTERWLHAQLGIFAPQIAALLHHRDARIDARRRGRHRPGILDDRRMHVISQCSVSVEHQLSAFDRVIH